MPKKSVRSYTLSQQTGLSNEAQLRKELDSILEHVRSLLNPSGSKGSNSSDPEVDLKKLQERVAAVEEQNENLRLALNDLLTAFNLFGAPLRFLNSLTYNMEIPEGHGMLAAPGLQVESELIVNGTLSVADT